MYYQTEEFLEFFQISFSILFPGKSLIQPKYIEIIADRITACLNNKINRLIINIPPRHMKSTIISVAFPAFVLAKDPTKEIIVASYSSALSTKHSLDTKVLMSSDWYKKNFPQTKISKIQNTKYKFITDKMGSRFATSVGGTLTGQGADIIIADDPISNLQASSKVFTQKVKEWFTSTFMTRLNHRKNGIAIILMHRLSGDDICGYLIKNSKNWHILSLPCLAEKDEEINLLNQAKVKIKRARGDILNSPYMQKSDIEEVKLEIGSYNFSCQYQQKPLYLKNSIIKSNWIKRYELISDIKNPQCITQSWDTAICQGESSSYSVCTTFIKSKNNFYLVDVFKERLEYTDLKAQLIKNAQKWQPNKILIENKSSGQVLIQDIKESTGLCIIGINPKIGKLERLYSVISLMESGRVFLPKNSIWLYEFEDELFSFPNSKQNDQVDSLVQYLIYERHKSFTGANIRLL